jgi:hypothetical protein
MNLLTTSYVQKLSLNNALLGTTNSMFLGPFTSSGIIGGGLGFTEGGPFGTNSGTFKGFIPAKPPLISSFFFSSAGLIAGFG